MKQGERELLQGMLGGTVTPAASRLYYRVREKLLLVGHNYDVPKEVLALIAVLADAVTQHNPEKVEQVAPEIPETSRPEITPLDEMSTDELDDLSSVNQSLDGDAAGGEYKGRRIKWETVFTSTPSTPITKLEKGRPISYISPSDGKTRAGRFVRINKDKRLANIESSEMKKVFSVPIKNIEITDLSPPSTIPLSVQI